MKKLVVISVLIALVISVSVWEIVYSTRVFSDIHGYLEVLEVSIFASDEIDSGSNLELVEQISKRWEESRGILFCFGHHNTLRQLDEKLSGLGVMVKINHVEDARVTVVFAKRLVKSILNDTHPHPTNLL